jgi:MFS family permease
MVMASGISGSKRGALYVACAMEAMSYGAVYALLASLQHHYHLPTWGLGAIGGANFAAQLVAQLTLARYADRGHTKLMLRAGVMIAAAGIIWFGVSHALWEFVAARVVLGLGSGIFLPAALRVVITSAPEGQGEAIGYLTAVQVAGFALGPPVAAGINALAGLHAPFLAQGAGLLACIPILARISEPPFAEAKHGTPVRRLIRIRAVRCGLAVGAGLFLTIGAFEAIWARFLTDRGATTTLVAVGVTVFAAPLVILAPLGGRIADRIGAARAAIAGIALLPAILASFALNVSFWPVIFIAMAQGAVIAVCLPAGQATIAQHSPDELLAAGQGLNGAVGAATAALASIATAAIYGASGSTGTWLTLAAATAAFAVIAYHWRPVSTVTRSGTTSYDASPT